MSPSVEQQLSRLRSLLPPPAYDADRRPGARTRQPAQRHAEPRPHRQPDRRLLERRAGTKSVLSALNVAYDTVERRGILGLPAHRLGDDAVRRGRGRAGDRGAGVPADGDLVRRPVRLQRGADQRLQHGPAGRAGRRHDRAALPLRAVAPAAAQAADISGRRAGDAAVADRLGRACRSTSRISRASASPTDRSAPSSPSCCGST